MSKDGDGPPDDGRIEPDGGNHKSSGPAIPGPDGWAEEERREQAIHDARWQGGEQPSSLFSLMGAIFLLIIFMCICGEWITK